MIRIIDVLAATTCILTADTYILTYITGILSSISGKCVVHSPTNALFINFVNIFKFTLKCTIISLLPLSVFNGHHQGALSVIRLYLC